MNYLLYRQVLCHSCGVEHDLCLVVEEEDRPNVRSIRYECPNSHMIVGERLKGHADQYSNRDAGWIECLPVYTGR